MAFYAAEQDIWEELSKIGWDGDGFGEEEEDEFERKPEETFPE